MADVQEQVEQYIYRSRPQTTEDWRVVFQTKEEFYALLRQVVEECCGVTDLYHADGLTELIQKKFAWLMEGPQWKRLTSWPR